MLWSVMYYDDIIANKSVKNVPFPAEKIQKSGLIYPESLYTCKYHWNGHKKWQ